MSNFLIIKEVKKRKVISFFEQEIGYELNPNIRNPKLIKIDKLFIMNEEGTNTLLCSKIEQNFHKLAAILLKALQDEEGSSSDTMLALNEIEKQKTILLTKYKDYIKKEELKKYINRLRMMEKEVKIKYVYLQNRVEESKKSHSR